MVEFISLTELGIGCILVRHAEIVVIEPTSYCFSKIILSNSYSKIVEESPICVLDKIKLAVELEAALVEQETNASQNNYELSKK